MVLDEIVRIGGVELRQQIPALRVAVVLDAEHGVPMMGKQEY